MSANLYDLLDVDESASGEEIRAAWKAAIADLDPTERRFRAYNDAASVLLDPERRAAYDAELAAGREAEEPEGSGASEGSDPTEGVDEARPDVAVPASPAVTLPADDADDADAADSADADAADDADSAGDSADDADDADDADNADAADAGDSGEADDATKPGGARPSRFAADPPGWAFGAAGLAAVLGIAFVVWVFTLPGVRAEDSPKAVAERASSAERATLSAETAAEQLVAPVLSYNHQTMAADLERLRAYVTPALAEKQAAAWPDITEEAVAQEIVVEATPTATALTRLSDDGQRATVVVFIDQSVEKAGSEPFALRMWATLELVRSSDGEQEWLLDDLCTDASCG